MMTHPLRAAPAMPTGQHTRCTGLYWRAAQWVGNRCGIFWADQCAYEQVCNITLCAPCSTLGCYTPSTGARRAHTAPQEERSSLAAATAAHTVEGRCPLLRCAAVLGSRQGGRWVLGQLPGQSSAREGRHVPLA